MEGLEDAECVLVFHRGLRVRVARHWSELDATSLLADASVHNPGTGSFVGPLRAEVGSCRLIANGDGPIFAGLAAKIEIAKAARWHPVVAGVEPFVCRNGVARPVRSGRRKSAAGRPFSRGGLAGRLGVAVQRRQAVPNDARFRRRLPPSGVRPPGAQRIGLDWVVARIAGGARQAFPSRRD